METRRYTVLSELRASSGGDDMSVEGYAARFDSLSREIADGVRELIKPGAFTKVLAGNPDVLCRYQHSDDRILGRTTNGTLKLSQDDKGLRFHCQLDSKNPEHVNLHRMVARKDVQGASFAFGLNHDAGDDEFRNGKDPDTNLPCIIRSIKNFQALHDVAIVVNSCYPAVDRSVSARAATNESRRDYSGPIRKVNVTFEQRSPVEMLSNRSRAKMQAVRIKIDNTIETERRQKEMQTHALEQRVTDAFAAVKAGRNPFEERVSNDLSSGAGISQPGSELDARPGAVPFRCSANSFSTSTRDDHRKASEQHCNAARHIVNRKEDCWAERADAHFAAQSAHAKAADQSDDDMYAQYAGLAQVACNRCISAGQAGKKP